MKQRPIKEGVVGRVRVVVHKDHETASQAMAETILWLSRRRTDSGQKFIIVWSGGGTIVRTQEILSTTGRSKLDWKRIYQFWGDEHAREEFSNYRDARERFILTLELPEKILAEHIYGIEPVRSLYRLRDLDYLRKTAHIYGWKIERALKEAESDLIHLAIIGLGGIDDDKSPEESAGFGHVASLLRQSEGTPDYVFYSQLLFEAYIANEKAPKDKERFTMTPFAMTQKVDKLILFATGSSKAEALRQSLCNRPNFKKVPGTIIQLAKDPRVVTDMEGASKIINLIQDTSSLK